MKTKEPQFSHMKSEVKEFSNLTGFFALLYQIDRRNKQISSNHMKIKKVEIVPVKPRNGLIGFAHVLFEEGLYLGSIGIFTKRDGDGYRLTYPTRRVGEHNITIFHPINSEFSKKFEKAVFQEAERVFSIYKL